jgi:hypothetical protein
MERASPKAHRTKFPFDLVFLGRGSVSFFDRVGFAHVFAIFCFAIKPGPSL